MLLISPSQGTEDFEPLVTGGAGGDQEAWIVTKKGDSERGFLERMESLQIDVLCSHESLICEAPWYQTEESFSSTIYVSCELGKQRCSLP